MGLPVPQLDDRHFQDLVDEAKKKIPHYSKEWTDHNVSDPGVTMIELFAFMMDVLLYRLNKVPDLHYIRFMEMFGIHLQGPVPARVPVTFWLSAPQPSSVVIPAGTEVSSTQTEMEPPVIFTTEAEFTVSPPELSNLLTRVTSSDGAKKTFREQNLRRMDAGFEEFDAFSQVPQVDDAMYFGFDNDLSNHLLGFEMACDPAGGAGIDPSLPPYIWEASTGDSDQHWQSCQVDVDTTRGMNAGGQIRIFLPPMGKHLVNGGSRYWVRARVKEISPSEAKEGMRPYRVSPRIRRVQVSSWGGTVWAAQSRKVEREFLGQSDGTPGQRFNLKLTPLLTRKPGESLTVQVEGQPPSQWKEVSDFASSGANDRHYTLDSLSGEMRFGPAVRQPDGTVKLYGAIPARGANLIFDRYDYGGGQQGNVQERVINTLKTAIPYIGRVSNRQPAWGGLDAETLEAAMTRAPAMLRSCDRAVTEQDYEFLARQALPAAIGRVKCLQPRPSDVGRVAPGQVYMLVIPRVAKPAGYIAPDALVMDPSHLAALTAYMDERRLLTTRVNVRPPAYHWVAVKVRLRAAAGADRSALQAEVLARLNRFINPLTGGPDGQGWEFGRELFISDIYPCLQGIPNLLFVRSLEMFAAQPGGAAQGEAREVIEVVSHGVVASGQHQVEFV